MVDLLEGVPLVWTVPLTWYVPFPVGVAVRFPLTPHPTNRLLPKKTTDPTTICFITGMVPPMKYGIAVENITPYSTKSYWEFVDLETGIQAT